MRLALLFALTVASVTRAQPVPVEDEPDHAALLAQAAALTQQSVRLYQQGRPVQAIPVGEQALALFRKLYPKADFPAGHPHLATSLNNLGTFHQARGDLAAAERLLRESLAMRQALFPPKRYPAGHADVASGLNNLAFLKQARGEWAEADELYQRALAMYRTLYPPKRFPRGHPELASCLNNFGLLARERGEFARGEPYYREALKMCRQLYPPERFPNGHPDLAGTLNNLGSLLQDRGELTAAEPYFREALTMYRGLYPKKRFPAGHPELATCLSNLGSLERARGRLDDAEPHYRDALAMKEAHYPTARFPSGHPDLVASLNNLGMLLQDQGELASAESSFQRAVDMCRALYPPSRFSGHPQLARCRNNLGVVRHLRGDLAGAERSLREALTMHQRLYPEANYPDGHPDLAGNLNNLGAVLAARGEPARAEPYCRQALAMRQRHLDALLAGLAEAEALNYLSQLPESQAAYLSVSRDLPDTDAVAYGLVWQGRGALARWLAHRRLVARASSDPEARALAERLTRTRQALANLLLARGPLGGEQVKRVRALTEEKERLEKALVGTLPIYAALKAAARATPDGLRRRLPEGAVYLDFRLYDRFEFNPGKTGKENTRETLSYVAFVLCPGREVRRIELGTAAPVDALVTAWRAALTGRGRDLEVVPGTPPAAPGNDTPEAALRRLLWEPLAKHLPPGTRTLYLCPDGALTQLPWAALPGEKPGTVLLEDYAVAVVPHGHFLLQALAARPDSPAGEGKLLAVGGVDYGEPADGDKLRWPPLPGTARELERVLGLAGKRPVLALRGREPSTDRFLAELPQARWAHLATHGFFAGPEVRSALRLSAKDHARGPRGERVGAAARSPLTLSGLVLTGANRPVKDLEKEGAGIVTAEALAGLDLDGLDLAVLSACETGLGEVAGGEGVFGLQRAFHVAGCKNVVATLWKVDDEATAALMGLFYQKLWTERLPPLEALRQAQLMLYRAPERVARLARARGPDFEKEADLPAGPPRRGRGPARLWAGFTLSGAGR
jgi:CHAT domain-containing protein/tetratricopeptide (TPR) repeat protein